MSTVRTSDGSVPSNPSDDYGLTVTRVVVNQAGAGTTVLANASSGNRHRIVGGLLTLSVVGTLKFSDGSGDLTGPMDIGATGGFTLPQNPRFPLVVTAVNSALNLVTTLGAARGVVLIVTGP